MNVKPGTRWSETFARVSFKLKNVRNILITCSCKIFFNNTHFSAKQKPVCLQKCAGNMFVIYLSVADIDECALDNDTCHDTLATCTNTVGGYTCECNTGYEGNGITCSGR